MDLDTTVDAEVKSEGMDLDTTVDAEVKSEGAMDLNTTVDAEAKEGEEGEEEEEDEDEDEDEDEEDKSNEAWVTMLKEMEYNEMAVRFLYNIDLICGAPRWARTPSYIM
eukprot:4670361-Pyramimonas_sp.AAC.1